MKTSNTIRNTLITVLSGVLVILFGLISQKVFLNTLGTEYLGINGLLTNLVSLLALAELGLGSAMYYKLYRPVVNNQREKIKSLLLFYKKAYSIIAIAVITLGLLVLPVLPILVGDISINENIYLIYLLFLADSVFSYFLVYKRALLYADQKNYIVDIVHMGYLIVLNIAQIAILIITRNFYLYLGIKLVMRLLENIVVSYITSKKYAYINTKPVKRINAKTKKDVYEKLKGTAYHRIGAYVVMSTDNIVISVFLGITLVGLYNNYFLVIAALLLVFGKASSAVTPSVGNMLVKGSQSNSLSVYNKISFANLVLSVVVATSFLVLMNGFITLWIGEKFLLGNEVLYVLALNLFLTLIRSPIMSYKEAAGIFHEDRLMPVLESVINLIFSISLLNIFGLAGVFMGTAISTLFLHLYSYPKYVYTKLLKNNYLWYYKEFTKKILLGLFVAVLTYGMSRYINIGSTLSQFVFNIFLCVLVPAAVILIIYRNNENYDYFKKIIVNNLKNISDKLLCLK